MTIIGRVNSLKSMKPHCICKVWTLNKKFSIGITHSEKANSDPYVNVFWNSFANIL